MGTPNKDGRPQPQRLDQLSAIGVFRLKIEVNENEGLGSSIKGSNLMLTLGISGVLGVRYFAHEAKRAFWS